MGDGGAQLGIHAIKRCHGDHGKQTLYTQYLLNGNDYNSFVYEWRKVETAPVAKVFEVNRLIEIDNLVKRSFTKCIIAVETF